MSERAFQLRSDNTADVGDVLMVKQTAVEEIK
jgi:hypothetical protein